MDQGKTVKGLRVLEEHPVETALSTPENPVYFSRIRLLVLEYGNQVYECQVCGYTDDTAPKVRGHLGREHPSAKALARRRKKQKQKQKQDSSTELEHARPEPGHQEAPEDRSVMDYTLGEVVSMASENRELHKENVKLKMARDEWRERAYESEKSLRRIRKALGSE